MTTGAIKSLPETPESKIINTQAFNRRGLTPPATDRIKTNPDKSENRNEEAICKTLAYLVHEINNPLSVVKNMFTLFKSSVSEEFPYQDFFEMVDNEINRIVTIVDKAYGDLNEFKNNSSSPINIQQVRSSEKILLEILLHELWISFEKDLSLRGNKFEFNISPDSSRLFIPESPMRQILINLIRNAIEASPSQEIVTISSEVKGEELNIRISDKGCGIPNEIRDQIFNDFYSTKSGKKSKNMGMGLPISIELVKSISGCIEFESIESSGTTFNITIPIES